MSCLRQNLNHYQQCLANNVRQALPGQDSVMTEGDALVPQPTQPTMRWSHGAKQTTLISGGFLYAGDLANTVIPQAWVFVEGDLISGLGSMNDHELPVCDKQIDATGKLILPGFVNPHWHESFVAPNFERPDDKDLQPSPYAKGGNIMALSSLFGFIGGIGDLLTKEEGLAIARWSLWTQLRSGTTCIGDVGSANRSDAVAEAAIDLGIRLRVSRWGADIMIPETGNNVVSIACPKRQWEDWLKIIEDWEDHSSGLVGAMPSVIGAFGSSDKQLDYLAQIVQQYPRLPYATHLASLRNEAEVLKRVFGRSAVERFDAFALLTNRLMAVHTAYVSEDEYQRLIANGVNICHSPAHYGILGEATNSETKKIVQFLKDGVWVSTSTDGDITFIGGMVEAMRGAHLGHNEANNDQTAWPPTLALRSATLYGARAMGWSDRIGSIELGKQADIVLVNADDYRYKMSKHPLRTFLVTGSSYDVDSVFVKGQLQVNSGASNSFNEQELFSDYEKAVKSAQKRIRPAEGAMAQFQEGITS